MSPTGRRAFTCSRRFVLRRHTDATGVSGTGVIVHGVQFPDGSVAYRWTGLLATTVVAARVGDVVTLHGHDGATTLEWIDS